MEKVTHIYIYGDIMDFQVVDGADWGCVSLSSVASQYNKNPDCEEIIVHVHSRGGDVFEGFAIHDFLVSTGKKITTVVEGLCASIATVIFLSGSIRQLTENSRFLIHNPWIFTEGSADDLETVAALLRVEQQKMLDFYVDKTTGDAESLQLLMNEDKVIDAETALSLGFATEIIETMEVVASVKNSSHQKIILNSLKSRTKKMKVEKKTKLQAMLAKTKGIIKDLAGLTDDDEAVVATAIDLSDGTQLFCAEDTLAVGVAVFTDAEMTEVAPDGDYTQADDSTITVADGAVSAITPKAQASAETDAEIIARLTGEVAAANARANENEVLATGLGESLETLQAASAKFKSSYVPAARKTEPNTPSTTTKGKATPTSAEPGLKEGVAAIKAARKAAGKK